ncbi:MAG: PAS domain-containing sensor histidine kinase [Gammaproteobacteria bacterium]|nr:PAS domain-containing sensor histidine kinase [Gammaproteobacteria bacterium]
MGKTQGTWRDERLGLTMIAASLAVIGLIVFLLFQYQHDTRQERLREQAISLTRVLAEIPFNQLVPQQGQKNILQALYLSHDQGNFAYATVHNVTGRTAVEVTAPGVIVPAAIPTTGVAWINEREISLASGRNVLEVHAPLFTNGEVAGVVTLGFFQPGFGLSYAQLPFFATLALVIFLLTPISYFAMRREIRPLRAATEQMGAILEEAPGAELRPSGELSDFMGRFSEFVGRTQQRIVELEQDHSTMLTSTKLISYRKSRIESVLESLPEALLVLDETGTISFANTRIASLFGVEPEELQGSGDLSWCPDANVCEFLSRCARRGPGGYVANAVQFSLDSVQGKTFSVSAYPLFSPSEAGKTLGTLVVFRDVTVEAMARQSRGEFVAHVAHELKTPLNVLGMYSEALLENGGSDETQRIECVNVIHDEVERLAGLVRNLLNITQIEMGSLQPVSTRSRVHELLADLFRQIQDGHDRDDLKFELDLPREISAMNLDKDLVRVALTNLLTNAIKYNKTGGTVRMSAEETDNALTISVSDDGIGISEADQSRIFDKFYRSEDDQVRERSGHGLGLSLARDIIHLHGGEITVKSDAGSGSEFVITLWKEVVRKVS